METPRSKAGILTEKIMQIFYYPLVHELKLPKIDTPTYNRIYEHVLNVLTKAFPE